MTHHVHSTSTAGGSRWCLAALMIAVSLTACFKKAPPPAAPAAPVITIAAPPDARVKATMTITASADANPDGTGRPSPVVVRVYQLRAEGAFNAAEYFPLYDDERMVLGQELVSRDEFVMTPGERRSLDVTLAADTRFVGVLAAFRDVRNAQWRAVVVAPKKGLAVSVDRARVAVAAGN